jgi:hypothetical protein
MENQVKEKTCSIRLVFGYINNTKSVLTAENVTKQDIHRIAEKIAESQTDFVLLDIPTREQDVLLLNKKDLVFFYATTKKHVRGGAEDYSDDECSENE